MSSCDAVYMCTLKETAVIMSGCVYMCTLKDTAVIM